MAWEDEKWEGSRQAEMYQKEVRFKQRLKAELVALKKRIASGKSEQKRQRHVDLERCVHLRAYACLNIRMHRSCLFVITCVLNVVCVVRMRRLLQRYQNVKAELEQQQNLERVRVEKFARTKTIGR